MTEQTDNRKWNYWLQWLVIGTLAGWFFLHSDGHPRRVVHRVEVLETWRAGTDPRILGLEKEHVQLKSDLRHLHRELDALLEHQRRGSDPG